MAVAVVAAEVAAAVATPDELYRQGSTHDLGKLINPFRCLWCPWFN